MSEKAVMSPYLVVRERNDLGYAFKRKKEPRSRSLCLPLPAPDPVALKKNPQL